MTRRRLSVALVACVGLTGCSSATTTAGSSHSVNVWVFGWAYDILLGAYNVLLPVSAFAFLIVLFVLCPMALFKRTRDTAAQWIFVSSYLFGLTTWCLGGLLTFATWGWVGLMIGLLFLGFGVVPMGILGAFFVLQEPTVGLSMIGMTVLIFATRSGGMFLRTHDIDDQQAADQGDPDAQFRLGYAYDDGGSGDVVEAVSWYRKAADQGHARAQFYLGTMYANGEGVPQDYAQAVAWYRKAAEQGREGAQFNLGFMYALGRGVPHDDVQAVAWYRKAADQGHAAAQFFLGVMYETGRGVPQDDVEAHLWHNLSASRAYAKDQTRFAKVRDALAAKMTPAQLADAQKRASEWHAAFDARQE